LKSKCKSKILISALFINKNKETISLQMFDYVIQHLFTLYQEQNPDTDHKSFSDLTDDIIEVLLTVEATAIFYEKKTVVTVENL